ncbi:MAG: hypothetical protein ACPGSD_17045 [Flavobacteriales bacterium]
MYRITLIILILFTIKASAQNYGYKPQKISLQARKHVHLLAKEKMFHYEAIGNGGYKSDTYKCFEKLKNKASTDEFIELCKHPSPVVRYYAFYELKNRKVDEDLLIPIIKSHLNDTATIYTQYGCLGDEEEIGSLMFDYISIKYKNDENFKKEINNHLFTIKGPFIYPFHTFIKELPTSEKNYLRLKKMVKEDSNAQALLPLLDYKNSNDWEYIQYILEKDIPVSLEAISRFPKATFIPFLEKIKHQTAPFPVQNHETWEWEIENQTNIYSTYSIFLNMENGVYSKGFDNIFKPHFSVGLKIHLSNLIYNLIKDVDEDWTLPVKYKILPYLHVYNKNLLTDLLENDSILFHKIVKHIPYRKTTDYYDLNKSSLNELETILRMKQGLNKSTFLEQELSKNINDEFFNYYFSKYIQLDPSNRDSILLNRVKLKMMEKNAYLDKTLVSQLQNLSKEKSKYQLWYLCYQYIHSDTISYPHSFLKIMDYHFKDKTNHWAFDSFMKMKYKQNITASIFNYLNSNNTSTNQSKLLNIYNNQSYMFKHSEFGEYVYKSLHPDDFYYYEHPIYSWL